MGASTKLSLGIADGAQHSTWLDVPLEYQLNLGNGAKEELDVITRPLPTWEFVTTTTVCLYMYIHIWQQLLWNDCRVIICNGGRKTFPPRLAATLAMRKVKVMIVLKCRTVGGEAGVTVGRLRGAGTVQRGYPHQRARILGILWLARTRYGVSHFADQS